MDVYDWFDALNEHEKFADDYDVFLEKLKRAMYNARDGVKGQLIQAILNPSGDIVETGDMIEMAFGEIYYFQEKSLVAMKYTDGHRKVDVNYEVTED